MQRERWVAIGTFAPDDWRKGQITIGEVIEKYARWLDQGGAVRVRGQFWSDAYRLRDEAIEAGLRVHVGRRVRGYRWLLIYRGNDQRAEVKHAA